MEFGMKIVFSSSHAPRLVGRRNRRDQRGMTTLGLIILVAFVGIFVMAGIRLTPVYLNYMKVAGVVNGVYEEFDGQNATAGIIRNSIIRRFSVESITQIGPRDVEVKPEDGGFMVIAAYDHTVPFIANVHFTVKFNESQLVRR
jgi:hypothetical protein